MKTRSAVLLRQHAERPYSLSRPIEVMELDLAGPRAGELLVRVEAAGVCHSDLSVVTGARPRPLPMALGHEAAGIVEDVGSEVRDVAVGDRVVLVFVPSCGLCPECGSGRAAMCRRGAATNRAGELLGGGRRLAHRGQAVNHHLGVSAFSDLVVVDRRSAVVVPPDLPGEQAALFGCALLTGMGAVHNAARPAPGESVAVVGLGGVGLAAVLAAKLSGAHPVLAIDPIEHKRETALRLGATHVFTPSESMYDEVRAVTGLGVDFAVEAAGSPLAMADAFAITRPGGTTVAVGLPHPDSQLALPAAQIVTEGRSFIGSYMGSSSAQNDIPRLVNLWRSGRLPLDLLASDVVTLEAIPEAMDALVSGSALRQLVLPARTC